MRFYLQLVFKLFVVKDGGWEELALPNKTIAVDDPDGKDSLPIYQNEAVILAMKKFCEHVSENEKPDDVGDLFKFQHNDYGTTEFTVYGNSKATEEDLIGAADGAAKQMQIDFDTHYSDANGQSGVLIAGESASDDDALPVQPSDNESPSDDDASLYGSGNESS